jgi:hypothetical protein
MLMFQLWWNEYMDETKQAAWKKGFYISLMTCASVAPNR